MIRALAVVAASVALALPTSFPATAAVAATDPSSALRWHECDASAPKDIECGTLTVPLDWSTPGDGREFQLPVGRIRATGSRSERLGVLMYNPGGPGAPGVAYLRRIHGLLPDDVHRRFDLITWNPRGTEGTRPALADCPAVDIEVPATGPLDWSAVATAHTADRSAALADCFARNSKVAPYLGTGFSARDIDALRAALGERQVSFWGMSYGSTMGRVYAQTFPSRVRTLILDGAIDPMATTGSYAREQMWSHAMSMARMQQWLTPAMRAAQRRVMAALDERTVSTSWGAEITRLDVDMGVAEYSARQFNWALARKTILAARDALFAPSQARRLARADDLAELLEIPKPGQPAEEDMSEYVLSFVNCSDFPERITVAEVVTVTEQSARISGMASGAYGLTEATMCVGLPVYGPPITQRPAIRIPNPPLIVNSVADPYTSLWSATLMANAFVGSRMITYDSTQHVTYSRTDSACVNSAVTRYLMTQELPDRDLACPLSPPFSPR